MGADSSDLQRDLGNSTMKHIVEGLGALLAVVAWIAGTVLAPGWWKLAAFVFPPYPWYLVVERAMQAWGLLACG